MDSRVRFWGHNPWHAPVGMLVMGEAGASTRAKRWHAGPWTQTPGQTPVVSSEAWMEVLAFLFWFGWRGGGPACASLTPLLGLLLCPPLLARVNPPTYKDLPGWRLESPDPPLYPADRPGQQSTKKNVSGAAASGEKGLGEDFSGRKPVR